MFIKDNKLYYDYNFLDGVHYVLESPPLPTGPTDLKFNFILTQPFGGTGELFVNGQKVDEVEMPQMHISTYSLAETFDVGMDTGTQVSAMYTDPFEFTGLIDRVIFNVSDDEAVAPRDMPTQNY
jgi:arylsulfatase